MILNIVKIPWSKPAEALSKLSPDPTTVLGMELLGGGATGVVIGFDLGLAILILIIQYFISQLTP